MEAKKTLNKRITAVKCIIEVDNVAIDKNRHVSKRFSVTVPDYVFEDLEAIARIQGRPTATLVAFLVEAFVRDAREKGELPSAKPPKQDGAA
ncbi:hypothetical protein H6H01_34490 [Nostoc calcicola FACHB-3891]|nr:hypothetical protein [Nostoc calcicola FACHB-3891]